jgi:hypothetical protein
MKMAKATEADMHAALDVGCILDQLGKGYMPKFASEDSSEDDEDEIGFFDIDNHDLCKKVLRKLLSLERSSNLFRVTFGMTVVLDPHNKLVDPNASTLEEHPENTAAKVDAARYRFMRNVPDADLGNPGRPCIAIPATFNSGMHVNGDDADAGIDAAIVALKTRGVE